MVVLSNPGERVGVLTEETESKPVLWEWKRRIDQHPAFLRLAIHSVAQPCPGTDWVPFLGFILFPDRRRLKRRKGVYFACKLRYLRQEYRTGRLSLDRL